MAPISPPPPYTLHDNMWRQRYLPTPESYLLSRRLLHIIVLVYEADSKALRNLLPKDGFQLNVDERKHLVDFSNTLKYALELASSDISDPTTHVDGETAKTEIKEAAYQLHLPAGFIAYWFWYYALNAGRLERLKPAWYWPWHQKRCIPRSIVEKLLRYTGDVIDCIEVISPNEEVQRLLTDTIVHFRSRHYRRDETFDQSWWNILSRE